MIRTLLVDDEELARERLKQLLQPYEDIEIVGQAGDGEEAIDRIVELAPDLVFLDIQMPACSGMEVAASLARESYRPVCFFPNFPFDHRQFERGERSSTTGWRFRGSGTFSGRAVGYQPTPFQAADGKVGKALSRHRCGLPKPEPAWIIAIPPMTTN